MSNEIAFVWIINSKDVWVKILEDGEIQLNCNRCGIPQLIRKLDETAAAIFKNSHESCVKIPVDTTAEIIIPGKITNPVKHKNQDLIDHIKDVNVHSKETTYKPLRDLGQYLEKYAVNKTKTIRVKSDSNILKHLNKGEIAERLIRIDTRFSDYKIYDQDTPSKFIVDNFAMVTLEFGSATSSFTKQLNEAEFVQYQKDGSVNLYHARDLPTSKDIPVDTDQSHGLSYPKLLKFSKGQRYNLINHLIKGEAAYKDECMSDKEYIVYKVVEAENAELTYLSKLGLKMIVQSEVSNSFKNLDQIMQADVVEVGEEFVFTYNYEKSNMSLKEAAEYYLPEHNKSSLDKVIDMFNKRYGIKE